MSRALEIAIGVFLAVVLGVGVLVLREADARRVWQRCNQGGFPFERREEVLNELSWLNHVECEGGSCRWRTWLNDWGCLLSDEGGVARQGGSG